MGRPDRIAMEDLDRCLRLARELKHLYPGAVDMADDVSLGGSVEGPSTRSGSYADPTANTALRGDRQQRRSSVKRARKSIGGAMRHLQEAVFHAVKATDG